MIKCECGKTIEKSKNGLGKYCLECKSRKKLERAAMRTSVKECKKCHGTFNGTRNRTTCYVCNPDIKTVRVDLSAVDEVDVRVCIECNTKKKMSHGNQKVCDECRNSHKKSKEKSGENIIRREISNIDFSAFDKFS